MPPPEPLIKLLAVIIAAVEAGVNWLESVKIKGFKYVDVDAPNEPNGKDRVILPDTNSTIWARFYEIGTNRPFFSGRDSEKKYDLKDYIISIIYKNKDEVKVFSKINFNDSLKINNQKYYL